MSDRHLRRTAAAVPTSRGGRLGRRTRRWVAAGSAGALLVGSLVLSAGADPTEASWTDSRVGTGRVQAASLLPLQKSGCDRRTDATVRWTNPVAREGAVAPTGWTVTVRNANGAVVVSTATSGATEHTFAARTYAPPFLGSARYSYEIVATVQEWRSPPIEGTFTAGSFIGSAITACA